MKTLKIIAALAIVLFMFSCQESYLEESIAIPDIKSTNSGNEKLTGYDEWGFNWNAQQFHGYTINMLLGDNYFMGWPHYQQHVYNGEGLDFWEMLISNYDYFPYLLPADLLDSKLVAIWNDGLISRDGQYPPDGWIDSDAWVVFNYSGKIGNKSWQSMRKLVAAKSTDVLIDGVWYNEAGQEIGMQSIFWNDLIIIQVVNNGDVPPFPFFYQDYNGPTGSGYGNFKLGR